MYQRMLIAALGATLGCSALLAQTSGSNGPATKSGLDLTPQNFAELHSLIRPHDNEWRHLKVEWLTEIGRAHV